MGKLRGVRCLVTGGAGYIGSHVVWALEAQAAEVVVVDDLSSGHRWAVGASEFVELDLADTARLAALLDARRFDALIHLAGSIWVGESVRDPGKYYGNNTANGIRLFALAARHGIRQVVFSSTAAVYGEPATMPIDEHTPLAPINPYGRSKLMAEQALADIARAHGQGAVSLRYFNVAGAHDDGILGEATPDNSHLIKVACETAYGLRSSMRINGTDYPTPDGTCVRDYIHVQDLAEAHVAVLARLVDEPLNLALNCGYGHGFSVREVLDMVQRVTGVDLDLQVAPRRPGDPPTLIADNRRILELVPWRPQRDDLERIVASAWAWEQRLQRREVGGAS